MCGVKWLEVLAALLALVTGQEPILRCRHMNCQHINYGTYEVDDVVSIKRLPVIATLEDLRLSGWKNPQPRPLSNCHALRKLHLNKLMVTILPNGWLANCTNLEVLTITQAYDLTMLPANLLLGAINLTKLSIQQGALKTVPEGLLNNSPNLLSLKISENYLKMLPSEMFVVARGVQYLDLTSNDLDGDAIEALVPLKELTELHLERNPRLGNICRTDGYSPIRNMIKLKKLVLRETGVNHICHDWRHDMTALYMLDLSLTKITKLMFRDLQFTRTVKTEVVLTDTPITILEMTREEYISVPKDLAGEVSVQLNAVLDCDCRMYWLRRALNFSLPIARQIIGELMCGNGEKLKDIPPEKMMCSQREECTAAVLPSVCTCSSRPDENFHHDQLLVRVSCENVSLTRMPRPKPFLHSTKRLYELLLRGNNITELHAEDLQQNIRGLDLRNNLIRRIDEETAVKLGSVGDMLWLAGNPLDCSCRAAPLLRMLKLRNATNTDRGNAMCDNGIALYAAPDLDCSSGLSPATWVAIVLGVLLTLAITCTLFLASRERRFFMMAVLHRWGVVWHPAEPEDAGRRYDAFLTFSHMDEAVVFELMARLEPTYRLCVHQRDWVPGHSICEQVVQSVRESRRTIALVSRHFLMSSWTLAEFREAHTVAMLDAKPRLVVVLLEDPSKLDMDEKLRRYVTTHTYIRWGDPWFWDKLAVALPKSYTSQPIHCDPTPAQLTPLLTKVLELPASNIN